MLLPYIKFTLMSQVLREFIGTFRKEKKRFNKKVNLFFTAKYSISLLAEARENSVLIQTGFVIMVMVD